MKQTCPKCKTIVEIDETIYNEGVTIDIECPVCGEQLQFYIPEMVVEENPAPQEETIDSENVIDGYDPEVEAEDEQEAVEVCEEDYIDGGDLDIIALSTPCESHFEEVDTDSTDYGCTQEKLDLYEDKWNTPAKKVVSPPNKLYKNSNVPHYNSNKAKSNNYWVFWVIGILALIWIFSME